MARTSKTKIGGGAGQQSDRMMRAADSGNQARERATARLVQQRRAGTLDAAETGQRVTRNMMAHEQQQMQQEAQRAQGERQDRAQKFKEGMATREQDFRERAEAGRQALGQQRVDMEAAARGLQRDPSSTPQSPLLQQRQAELQSEMDRGRQQTGGGPLQGPPEPGGLPPDQQENLRRQAEQPMEMGGGVSRPFSPTPAAQEQAAFDRQARAEKLVNERMRQKAYTAQVAQSYEKARLQQDKEAMEAARNRLLTPIKHEANLFNRFMQGKNSADDWRAMKKMAKDADIDPSMHGDLQNDLKLQRWTPRVQQFLRAHISKKGLEFIQATGTLPGDEVDRTSPMMQEFEQASNMVNDTMRILDSTPAGLMGMSMSQWMGIDSIQAKNIFINRMAARMVLEGQGPGGPFGGMPAAQSQAAQSQYDFRQGMDEQGQPVTDQIAQRRMTPEEEEQSKYLAGSAESRRQQQNQWRREDVRSELERRRAEN